MGIFDISVCLPHPLDAPTVPKPSGMQLTDSSMKTSEERMVWTVESVERVDSIGEVVAVAEVCNLRNLNVLRRSTAPQSPLPVSAANAAITTIAAIIDQTTHLNKRDINFGFGIFLAYFLSGKVSERGQWPAVNLALARFDALGHCQLDCTNSVRAPVRKSALRFGTGSEGAHEQNAAVE